MKIFEKHLAKNFEELINPISQHKALRDIVKCTPDTIVEKSTSDPTIVLKHPNIDGFTTEYNYPDTDSRNEAYTRLFHLWSDEEEHVPDSGELPNSFVSPNFIAPNVLARDSEHKDWCFSVLYQVTSKNIDGLLRKMKV